MKPTERTPAGGVETLAELVEAVAKGSAWATKARAAADLYEQMAANWWAGLSDQQRTSWLEAAAFDGRDAHPVAAFTLMGDLKSGAPVLYVYPTEGGEFGGQVVDSGRAVCGLQAPTEAELLETADSQGYGSVTRVRVGSLAEVPGFTPEK